MIMILKRCLNQRNNIDANMEKKPCLFQMHPVDAIMESIDDTDVDSVQTWICSD